MGRLALLVVVALSSLASCGDDGADGEAPAAAAPTTAVPAAPTSLPAEDPVVFPGADWAEADPADHGIDPAALEDLDAYYESSGSNCVAVVKDGYLVHENYWNGQTPVTDQEIFSASKSVTSTLVGIAQDLGFLDIDDRASTWLREWVGTPSEEVTIRNLLSNDSGRHYDFRTDYVSMATGAADKTAFAMGLSQDADPGTTWAYNNSAVQTLEEVLARATGQEVGPFAAEHLFEPIGMTSTIRTDAAGNALTFIGTQASCRDLARFGYLALREGAWDGRQVVSADYLRQATSPSQGLNTVYGYLWWLNGDGPRLADPLGGPGSQGTIDDGSLFWPDAPPDAYGALGLGGQQALVVPSEDLVVIRLGPPRGGSSPNEILRLVLGG